LKLNVQYYKKVCQQKAADFLKKTANGLNDYSQNFFPVPAILPAPSGCCYVFSYSKVVMGKAHPPFRETMVSLLSLCSIPRTAETSQAGLLPTFFEIFMGCLRFREQS
jgi:hypothetical protein